LHQEQNQRLCFMPEKPVEQLSTSRPNESVACEVCGRFEAVEIGDRLLCTDCYGQTCGSCCPEFGREEA
jgi:hypothetical protein